MPPGHRRGALVAALACALCAGGARATPARDARVRAPAGGAGGSKRLLAKARHALLAHPSSLILVDGSNVRGHGGFRTSEGELHALVSAWAAAEPAASGRVLLCFDGADGAATPRAPDGAGGGGGGVPVARASAFGARSADELIVTAVSMLPSLACAPETRPRRPPPAAIVVTADRALLRGCGMGAGAGAGVSSVHPSAFGELVRQRGAARTGSPTVARATEAAASLPLLLALLAALAARANGGADGADGTAGARGASGAVALRAPAAPRGAPTMRGADDAAAAATRAARAALSVRFVCAMFVAGALLGPWLDGYHGAFGVLAYEAQPLCAPARSIGGVPIALELPVGPLAAGAAARGVLRTAVWVPPLFGVAGALIGGLYASLDAAAASARAQRDVAGAQHTRAAEPSAVLCAVGCFATQYWASGALWAGGAPAALAYALLSASAAGVWLAFDGTAVGLAVGALTALGGPAIEVALVHMPEWLPGVAGCAPPYMYAAADLPALGIPGWIAPVYFAGAPAVGALARLAKARGL
ncbi:hypothetical protein KFE25_002363 [Diacronema lutheri]|uniref:Uncharacterized protein n=1 Tax=Diacronema lutheri TaxID=2081491 RepID=A0A8J5XBN7_DIALT|nr:hypothetical protein KFE25_002363 [Diacronema lutheri]